MPNTFGDLIDQAIATLSGFTTDIPVVGTLLGTVDAAATTLTVDFGTGPGRPNPNTRSGLLEVGSELLQVTRFDSSTNTATVAPWGRGARGTTPAEHLAGAQVTVAPRFPRKHVGDVINQVLASSSPPLFAPANATTITTGSRVDPSHVLPRDTIRILRMTATVDGRTDTVHPRSWWIDRTADEVRVVLPPALANGTVRITVAVPPGQMTGEGDDFTGFTGLAAGCAEMALFGAIARLAPAPEMARHQLRAAEAADRTQMAPPGSALNVSKYYQALYQQRLEFETRRLQEQWPPTLLRRSGR